MLRPQIPIAYVLSATLGLTPFVSAISTPAAAYDDALTRQAYENCQTQDEAAFRTAIEKITIAAFEKGTANLNYQAAVDDAWRNVGLDEAIDTQVDEAVTDVRNETSWGSLIRSLADQERAKELATAVAERVYRSERIKDGIEKLAVSVGNDVGRQVEVTAIDAARPALACLKAFLGPRYGTTVTAAVTAEARQDFNVDANRNSAEVTSSDVLKQSTGGLTGAAILLVRRQLANMARRVGARLVGSVLSRLVSVVAGGVGVVLIAKDLWDLRNGVLPIIADEMKSDATKTKVREELAKSIRTDMQAQVRQIGTNSADRIMTIWREFKSAHNAALELATRNTKFKTFLDNVRPQQLAQLDEVIAIVRASEGDTGVIQRLDNGSLEQAVKGLPNSAMTIARETRKLDEAIKWHALAGDENLTTVVDHGLHRSTTPDTLTKSSLNRILSVDDPVAMVRLAGLSQEHRTVLLELETADLRKLSRRLTRDELQTLSAYLSGLNSAPRQRVLRAVADAPQKMLVLSSDRVRRAIVGSADQSAAVAMMLRADQGFNPITASEDIDLVWNGNISPILLWDKHPVLIIAALILLIMLGLMVRRVVAPRRSAPPSADLANVAKASQPAVRPKDSGVPTSKT